MVLASCSRDELKPYHKDVVFQSSNSTVMWTGIDSTHDALVAVVKGVFETELKGIVTVMVEYVVPFLNIYYYNEEPTQRC